MGGNEVQALEMVWIRMSEDEEINLSYLLLPEEWSNYILADIKTVLTKTSPIHQHSLPFWKMGRHEEKQIKEDDFKSGWGGDKEGGIWKRGRESHGLKKDHCNKVIHLDE